MQLPLSFVKTPEIAPEWATLDAEHQTLVVTRLASLMAKLTAARRASTSAADQEPTDA